MSTAPSWLPGRVMLVALALVLVIGAAIGFLIPRNSASPAPTNPTEPPRTNPAVKRVLHRYGELADKYLRAKPDTTPTQYAWSMGQLCDELDALDKSDCPGDFQVACAQNIRAIRDAQAVLQRSPHTFLQGMAVGAMNYLRGEQDGGLIRMENDVREALKRIRDTSDEVERIAAKYTD